MNILVKLELLRMLIERGRRESSWFGKTAIQKMVYLLQEVFDIDLGYSFGLHHYGPYSTDLAEAVSLGEQAGLWESQQVHFHGGSGLQFKPTSKPLPGDYQRQAEAKWSDCESKLDAAFERLSPLNASQLELIATIHYLRVVQKVKEDELSQILRLLKPKFTEENVDWGKQQLLDLEVTSIFV